MEKSESPNTLLELYKLYRTELNEVQKTRLSNQNFGLGGSVALMAWLATQQSTINPTFEHWIYWMPLAYWLAFSLRILSDHRNLIKIVRYSELLEKDMNLLPQHAFQQKWEKSQNNFSGWLLNQNDLLLWISITAATGYFGWVFCPLFEIPA